MTRSNTHNTILYIAALICLLVISLFMFGQSDFFSVKNITIEGLKNISKEEIEKLVGTVKGENIFLLDIKTLIRKMELHPFVEKVSLKRELPGNLRIKIKERIPAALILNQQEVVEVDYQGIILRFHESWPKTDSPVVTGIEIPETVGPGQKIESPRLDIVLHLLGQAPQELLPVIGEVHLNSAEQVFLYLTSGIEVRLGHNEDYAGKLALLNELITTEEYKSMEKAIKYIDLTAGKPVLGQ